QQPGEIGMHVSRSRLVLILLSFAMPPLQADPLDRALVDYMQSHHIPGASVAIVHNDEVVLARGFGTANLESGAPATEHTVYPMASLTKQFTAAAIMLLAEKRKLSLDDKVTALVDGLPAEWNPITIRHLLSHTSGI